MATTNETGEMNKDGIIIKGIGGAYTVLADGTRYICSPRGIFRNRNETPLVGDMVTISVTDENKQLGTLHTIKPRKNQLHRPPIANVEQVIITVSVAQPAFNPGLLDRFLALAEYENISAVICVSKSDIKSDINIKESSDFTPYSHYPIVYTSTKTNNGNEDNDGNKGLDDLRAIMTGKLNVFAGASGVGKSSLINALMPNLHLETGVLSHKLGRGKHTTRHTEIFMLDSGGYCADTPGFTSLDMSHIPANKLAYLFLEFVPFITECRFSNCLHDKESFCAVKEQVGKGIHPQRYSSYVNLLHNSGASKKSNQ